MSAVTWGGTLRVKEGSSSAASGSIRSSVRGYFAPAFGSERTEKEVTSLPVPEVVGMATNRGFSDAPIWV